MSINIKKNAINIKNGDTYDNVDAFFAGDIEDAVEDWLENHPDVTTTVKDGSISPNKLTLDLLGDINAAKAAINGVLVAENTSQMTQGNTAYVYTGSQTGYTAGKWYYKVGNTIKQGGTYQGTVPVVDDTLSISGAAADAKVTGDEIADLKSALAVAEQGTIGTKSGNLFSAYTENYYWSADGTLNPSNSFCASDAIDVSGYHSIIYSGIGTPGVAPFCLWIGDDQVLYAFTPKEEGDTIVIPEGARSIKFSIRKTNVTEFKVIGKTQNIMRETVNSINSALNGYITTSGNKLNTEEIEFGKNLIKADGTLTDNEGYLTSGFIDVVEKPYFVVTKKSSYSNERVCMNVYRAVFYDSSKTIISSPNADSENKFALPPNSKYVRFSIAVGSYDENTCMAEFITSIQNMLSSYVPYSISNKGVEEINSWVNAYQKQIDSNTNDINLINSVTTFGCTWDWWISANSIDKFGNVYIGYVDTESYAGVLRRQPDGTMQYKRLEASHNDDDHNGMATIVLDDGRILVIGAHSHGRDNHIICYRSTTPYSIDDMERLSFDIPENGDYSYHLTYSQIFKYDGKLYNFCRCSSVMEGGNSPTGYICLVSTDNGNTWTAYKAVCYRESSGDPYITFNYTLDDAKMLKAVYGHNPSTNVRMLKGFTFDMSTEKFYDLAETEIGHLVPLNGESVYDSSVAIYENMTDLVSQGSADHRARLFTVARSDVTKTIFLYAIADDSSMNDFTYILYNDGTSVEIGKSGTPFGNNHYISGICFGNTANTLYYSKATTTQADGNHELHKVKMRDGSVETDVIITESSMCILKPLFLGNGEIGCVIGHYNDQTDNGYNGSFIAWELKPFFTQA